ncbi:hypothetical protein [Saccharopolyspora flava]|uniref:Mycothiol maleylpyruvate isomerase N-terminal domain-containing protein n=1 Tax=Saccharopolyspora flava TaxID=95161 RepID=A0A1I6SW91_9PSEU|nr:hypothetical protein [Saccharopolyspora flava]SFS81225.1 hypothetical protein SAMN05660874_03489 [Saccharopolyspora flava]
MSRTKVSADDLDAAVRLSLGVLRQVPAGAWRDRAGSLQWDRWETVEHLGDDLFSYAVQLGPSAPPRDREMPFLWWPRREGGPFNAVHADPDAGPDGLLLTLEAAGALLVAMVRTASPGLRSYHVFGVSDPEGFAAMGVVETLVHTHDVTDGLGLAWDPPAGLCAKVLDRLFPDAPTDTDPWTGLLWCTGRADVPGRARLDRWRWHGTPRDGSVGEFEADDAGDQPEQQGDLER